MKATNHVSCSITLQWDGGLKGCALQQALTTPKIKACLRETLAVAQCQVDAEINVRMVDLVEAFELNHTYRHKAYATNVLTFAYESHPILLADLVLCAPVLEREAQELNRPLSDHFAHLLVHGCLHALGFDHEEDEWGALQMEVLEVMTLDNLKVPNPYEA
jgi:probable rRNA maturation factor